jgi:hypothetical protein
MVLRVFYNFFGIKDFILKVGVEGLVLLRENR